MPDRPAFQPITIKQREFTAKDFSITVPAGFKPEELLRPSIWAHNAKRFAKGSYIHVDTEDGNWAALYRVQSCGETWAKVHQCWLTKIEALSNEVPDPDELFKIDNVAAGWRVIYKETGKPLKTALESRADAEAYIAGEISKMKK